MKKGLINSIFTHLPDILFLVINSLFVAKYSVRYNISPFGTALINATFSLVFLIFRDKINFRSGLYSKQIYILISILLLLAVFVIQQLINPYDLQVDRWSAIHNFIQKLFQGKYPYAAQTHLGGYGSPFPVWQLFHIPFYWMGNISLAFIFVIALLIYSLPKIFNSYRKATLYIILFIASPAFWYEVAVRSDLLYNFMLCFILCAFIVKNNYSINNKPIALGVLCGLILSTRFSVLIPFAITMGADFLNATFKNKTTFTISTLTIFTISFLPFIFWDWNSLLFFEHNPFILQTRQGSITEIILLLAMLIGFSIFVKRSLYNVGFYSSITIFVFVAATFLHRMIDSNFANDLFSSSFDISYFNMALPFVIFNIAQVISEQKSINETK